jgi:menaquinone-specific isochorismate synthase
MAPVHLKARAEVDWIEGADRAPDRRRWRLASRRVAAIDPWALLDGTDDDAVLLWRSPTDFDLALGAVAQLQADGPGRLSRVRSAATAVLDQVEGGSSGLTPRLFGGFAFADAATELPAASFVLPRWWWAQRDGITTLTVTVGHDEDPEDFAARAPTRSDRVEAVAMAQRIRRPAAAAWRAEVEAVLTAISRNEISKLVCVRPTVVELSRPLAVGRLLGALEAPRALRYLVRRNGTSFFGATPERLVSLDGRKIATEAIAGTSLPGSDQASALLASAKEREEHRIVVEEISAALAGLGAATISAPLPEPLDLGRLQHLRTRIAARSRRPTHLLEVAERLHPTPAVAGAPREQALDLLARQQPRGAWYSGAVGWFDCGGDGELHVALRCGSTRGRKLELWAGAGIVAGSDPERELQEIRLKTSTLLAPLLGSDPSAGTTISNEESS